MFKTYRSMITPFKGPTGQEDMPYLLTPGPVTTSRTVKQVMLADMSPSDPEYSRLVYDVRQRLLGLLGASSPRLALDSSDTYDCVVLGGGEGLARLAVIANFCPQQMGKTLIYSNGSSGRQAAQFLERLGRPFIWFDKDELQAIHPHELAAMLERDATISHVWLVHGEASSGLINPLAELGSIIASHHRRLLLDATLTVGSLPLHLAELPDTVLFGVGDIGLGSVPDAAFIIAKARRFQTIAGMNLLPVLNVHELFAAQNGFKGQAALMPSPSPQVLLALQQALVEFEAQGGVAMKAPIFDGLKQMLITGMQKLGFSPYLDPAAGSPLMQCFVAADDFVFDYEAFSLGLRQQGFIIAPGVLRDRASFRMGVAGALDEKVIRHALEAVTRVVTAQNFQR